MLAPPWVVVFLTLATNPTTGAVSTSTTTTRFVEETTCRQVSADYTFKRTIDGITVIGSARCYQD